MTLRYNKIIIPTLSTITGILWQYYGWSFFALLFLIPFFTIINFFYSKNYRQALAIFFISATLFSLGAFRLLNRQKQQNGFYKKYSNKELATIATIHDIKEIEGKFYKNCITIVAEKIKQPFDFRFICPEAKCQRTTKLRCLLQFQVFKRECHPKWMSW